MVVFGLLFSLTTEAYTLNSTVQSKLDFDQNKKLLNVQSLKGKFENVIAYNKEYLNADQRTVQRTVSFPDASQSYGNVIMHLQLDCPEGKCDSWDRVGYVAVIEPNNKEIEITRFITPYGIGGKWSVDVTPLQSLLKGSVKMKVFIDTWVKSGDIYGNGWLTTISFDFKDRLSRFYPVSTIPLWNEQNLVVGDETKPISKKIPPVNVNIPANAVRIELRSLITGHGQYLQEDEAKNCAEFCPKTHTFTVERKKYSRTIWRNDCKNNPLGSSQKGTWDLARAGWCPGDTVTPWIENVTEAVKANSTVQINYELESYKNPNKNYNGNTHTEPYYRISSVLLIYTKPNGTKIS